jgi:hypothetical protein
MLKKTKKSVYLYVAVALLGLVSAGNIWAGNGAVGGSGSSCVGAGVAGACPSITIINPDGSTTKTPAGTCTAVSNSASNGTSNDAGGSACGSCVYEGFNVTHGCGNKVAGSEHPE